MVKSEQETTAHRVDELCSLLNEARTLLIVMQDYPDPDALASAAGLRALAHACDHTTTTLASGGVVGRAENRALARYLRLPLRRLDEVATDRFDVIALVDTQPGTGNNALANAPQIVLDHHPLRDATRACPFFDVRPVYGATSTIVHEYLVVAGVDIDKRLATALVYGIRSDTHDLGRDACRADIDAMAALYPTANHRMLSEIQTSKTPRAYFRMIATALENAYVLGDCVVSDVGHIETPDIVGEIADLLLRDEACQWSLCFGVYDSTILLSLRTSDRRAEAGGVMKELVAGIGTGGGHRTMAGGQIHYTDDVDAAQARLQLGERITNTLRQILGIEDGEAEPFL